MKACFLAFVILITGSLASANAQQAVSVGVSGYMSYATIMSAAGAGTSATFSKSFKACCGSGAGSATCCPMAVISAASAVSLLMNSGEASGYKDTASCDSMSDSTFCNWNTNLENGIDNQNNLSGNDNTLDLNSNDLNADGSTNQNTYGSQSPAAVASLNAARARINASANSVLNDMKSKGYSLSTDGKYVTNPDGSITPVSALGNASAMKNHGFSDSSIASAQDVMEKMKGADPIDGLKKYGFSYSGGNGAGWKKQAGKGSSKNQGPNYDKLFNKFMKKDKTKASRGVAAAAGLSKKLSNGENIGVAADNIFHMVHRRYQKKKSESSFIPSYK